MVMEMTDRQKDILCKAVFEYIHKAEPVSSGWLEERYDMAFSPATIRAELLWLTEEGYVEQPHTSAGRVPTDKGYRFFVNELLGQEEETVQEEKEKLGRAQHVQDYAACMQALGKRAADISSSLTIVYIPGRELLWKEGWEKVLGQPEFENKGQLGSFAQFLRDVEEWMQTFRADETLNIYIGCENEFSKERDFTVMLTTYELPKHQEGLCALVGPKRMEYEKNIGLLHSLQYTFT
jgi:transcriptional regulator of heat shock response